MHVRVAHISLQHSDTNKQHTSDIEKIFDLSVKRKHAWLMGTEAGPGSGNMGKELLRIGNDHEYRMWVPSEQSRGRGRATDCWIAVRENLITGGWKRGYEPVIPGSQQLYKERGLDPDLRPRWGPKGVVHAQFTSIPQLGEINLAAAHHLTGGQRDNKKSVIHGVDHHEWNEKLDKALGKWLTEKAKGRALSFASMDRNVSDRRNPANVPGTTSLADELRKWQNTGHGDIDWILSTNKDTRVKGVKFNVLDDREFHLHTDHFLVEGVFDVEPLKR